MIDLRKCPNGIRMDGIAFTQAARELARAQNQNLEIFQWMGNQMQKLSKQVDELEKLDKIEQIVNEWNNDASNSFGDMCKINRILKE